MRGARVLSVAIGLAAGLTLSVLAPMHAAPRGSETQQSTESILSTDSRIDCVASIGTFADYFGNQGVSEEKALAEAKFLILRDVSDLRTSNPQRVATANRVTYFFQNYSGKTAAQIDLKPVGNGWRLEGARRCINT